MKKKYILFTLFAFLVLGTGVADAQGKRNTKSVKEIQARYDSLQQAFNELADDYAILRESYDSLTVFDADDSLQVELSDGEIVSDPLIRASLDTSYNTDSLLSIWYSQRDVNNMDREIMAMDSIQFTSNIPDSVYISRLSKMNSFIPLSYNSTVRNYIILYTEKMPGKISEILGLSYYYMPIIEEIIDKYDMPKELRAVPVIESAMNAKAVSRAGAKGLWQFMYSTAKMYKLDINSFVDERCDPIKSTDAAMRYLRDSYAVFGDWMLAIASYNCGAGNVSKAIRRSGGSHDFWTIYPYLPRETRGYVPAFIGALYTLTYYREHGITPAIVDTPVHTDTFHVNKMVHFEQIAYYTGAPVEQIRNVNPQYTHDIIPGSFEKPCILTLPYTYSMAYVDKEPIIPLYRDSVYLNPVKVKNIKESGTTSNRIVHKVKRGETLGGLATRYHTTITNIKKWNHLKGSTIRIGQRLYIYK